MLLTWCGDAYEDVSLLSRETVVVKKLLRCRGGPDGKVFFLSRGIFKISMVTVLGWMSGIRITDDQDRPAHCLLSTMRHVPICLIWIKVRARVRVFIFC